MSVFARDLVLGAVTMTTVQASTRFGATRVGICWVAKVSKKVSVRELKRQISEDRRSIGIGDRPVYHATWATTLDGAVDVRVRELPIIHLFVPNESSVLAGARALIAQTLGVDPSSFDIQSDAQPFCGGP